MTTGVIKFFNSTKGFGFIAVDGDGDVFVHVSGLADPAEPQEGDHVEFEITQDRRSGKSAAVNVRVTERASPRPPSVRGRTTEVERISLGDTIGTVVKFDVAKGYGFLQPEVGGPEVFVHASAAQRAGLPPLMVGQVLTFEVEEEVRTGRLSATNLRAG